MNKNVFGAIFMLLATAIAFVSCDNSDLNEELEMSKEYQAKSVNDGDPILNTIYESERNTDSDNMEMIYVYTVNVHKSGKKDTIRTETQPLFRSITTIDLGTHKVNEFGTWNASNGNLTPGEVSESNGYGNFIVRTRTDVYGADLSNGTLNLNSKYELTHCGAVYTNSDTTIVFPILDWAVSEEATNCDGNGNLNNTVKTVYMEYIQMASESGKLTKEEVVVPSKGNGRAFGSAKFSATINPNAANAWMFGAALTFADGTLALPIAKDGTPDWDNATWWKDIKDNSLNGAYYVSRQHKWYPVIASDQNAGMEWSLCSAQGSHGLNLLDYAGADTYGDWNCNDKNSRGQHTVLTNRFRVEDNAEAQTLTIYFNNVNKGTYSYAGF
jgi:hypothetical protein